MRNLRKPRISLLMRGVPAALAALALSSCSSVTGSLDGVTGFEKVSGFQKAQPRMPRTRLRSSM